MFRSFLSVVAGYLSMVVVVGASFAVLLAAVPSVFPSEPGPFDGPAWVLLVELGFSLVAALLGGFVCGLVANRAHMRHAIVLASLMLVLGLVSAAMGVGMKPLWSSLAIAVFPPLATLGGAALRVRMLRAM